MNILLEYQYGLKDNLSSQFHHLLLKLLFFIIISWESGVKSKPNHQAGSIWYS